MKKHRNVKGLFSYLYNRTVIVGISILMQAAVLVLMLWRFSQYFPAFYVFSVIVSVLAVLRLVNNNRSNPGYKIAWIILIMGLPIFGGIFYLLFSNKRLSARQRRRMQSINEKVRQYGTFEFQEQLDRQLEDQCPAAARQSRYLSRTANSPLYQNTSVEYFPLGEYKFARMVEELEKAEHFIFLEYFIIQEGKMWDTILEILKRKAAQGVEVRLLYDDMGCLLTLPYHYDRQLEKAGIQCCVFNPFVPLLNARMNNRDHRKICVIDGWVGFTGGINLADEYINEYEKHGHWKDTAVMLKGDAVWSLTVLFLSMWSHVRGVEEDFSRFSPGRYQPRAIPPKGYVQPYGDDPLDGEPVGETVYIDLIYNAKKYIYICTPYLIVDHEMVLALTAAAKSGVDVRIITPHVPDKWYVHAVTRAYYPVLIQAGVKVYEYTPGFIHAKSFVVDGEYATVGTINMDYRSLYLHFECGVWMYKTPCIQQMEEDFMRTLEQSGEVSLDSYRMTWWKQLGRGILRVFAPLM